MPDWSYRTVLRPALFLLPPAASRDLALGLMGTLARSPLGPTTIDLLGHMRADPRLRRTLFGIDFPSAVGLGAGLDTRAVAFPALARFGLGFLEAGPVTLGPTSGAGAVDRRVDRQSIVAPDPPDNPGVEALAARLSRLPRGGPPILARLAFAPGTSPARAAVECRRMVEVLAPHADAFVLAPPTHKGEMDGLSAIAEAARASGRPWLLGVPPDLVGDGAIRRAELAIASGAVGLLVVGGIGVEGGLREMGRPVREPALQMVRLLRGRFGEVTAIVASGGVHEPADGARPAGGGGGPRAGG